MDDIILVSYSFEGTENKQLIELYFFLRFLSLALYKSESQHTHLMNT